MTTEEINDLVANGKFPSKTIEVELVETHISWVMFAGNFVYKLKKPILYSFLDFSTLEKRKYYCQREIELNSRLTEDVYLDVVPVRKVNYVFVIGGEEGELIDYAVRMRRIDRARQMDVLLTQNRVFENDIEKLAEKIAAFHNNTMIIYQKNYLDVVEQFKDLEKEKHFLQECLGQSALDIVEHAMSVSDTFINKNKTVLKKRLEAGFFRDCHGDLHSRNIFLLASPQPFDCIEFNDDLRQIDVLNEVAFLCMDLDAFGRPDLAGLFIQSYNNLFPAIQSKQDELLFLYYKSYRSNVRAKVNSLRAAGAPDKYKQSVLKEVRKYLDLMNNYVTLLAKEIQ
jgi:hypothetical protein